MPSAKRKVKVAMLVLRKDLNDSRVRKFAECVEELGHEVRVYYRKVKNVDLPDTLEINRVTYIRIPLAYFDEKKNTANKEINESKGSSQKPNLKANLEANAKDEKLFRYLIVKTFRFLRAKFKRVIRIAANFFWKVADPTNLRNEFLSINLFKRAAGKHVSAWQPDIVHANDLKTLPAAIKISKNCGAHVIYDTHEFATRQVENEAALNRKYKYLLEKRNIKKADAVITVSSGIATLLKKYYQLPCKPSVVYNTPIITKDPDFSRDLRSELGLSPDTPLVAYIGLLSTNRAMSSFVESLKFMPNFHYAKIGGVTRHWDVMTDELVKKFKLENRFHVVPNIKHNNLVSYLKSADISAITLTNFSVQQRYAMPNKFFESIFAELPIACANSPELRSVIQKYNLGLIIKDCSKPKEIANTIKSVYQNKENFSQSAETKSELHAKFNWDSQKEKIAEIYRQFSSP